MHVIWRILIVILVAACFGLGAVLADERTKREHTEKRIEKVEELIGKLRGPQGEINPWTSIARIGRKIEDLRRTDSALRGQMGGWETDLQIIKDKQTALRGLEKRVYDAQREQIEVISGTLEKRALTLSKEITEAKQGLRHEWRDEIARAEAELQSSDRAIYTWVDKLRVQGRFSADIAPTPDPR